MAGLDAEHAAKCGWTDHRAIGLRSDRQRHHACRHSRSRTRRRAAGRPLQVAWIACLAWMEIGKFRRHRLADDDRSRLAQLADSGAVGIWPAPRKNRRTAFGRIVRGVEDVLDSDRNAVQRPGALATGLAAIERTRLRQRVLRIQMDESVDFALDSRNPLQAGARIVLGGNRAARDFRCSLDRCQRSYVRRHRGSSAATASCPARNT